MQIENSSSVFELLAKPVHKALAKLGFSEPTLPQTLAFPPIWFLSYGKQAVRALQVKGVGPETASRILGKMHPEEEKFYLDLLKAKIQYLRTREFWDK